VAIGRPVLWAVACGGAPGVKSVYSHIAAELKAAMLLSGVSKVTALKREHLALRA
jgi:isopentenyl diphosphate isomerase/L-lactate dehydrogenase-like FMN-dependent dehydrogenase